MSRLTLGQKAQRVLELLFGLRNARIASTLAAHGFTEKDLDEGWSLLKALTENRLANVPPPPADPSLLIRVDQWENMWFPIAQASLQYSFPEAYAWMFNNLHQTDGVDVLVSVGTFIDRFGKLASQKDVKDAAAAHKRLVERGLGVATIDEAQQLLKAAGTISREPPPPAIDPEQQRAAEDALWHWYLEWSGIARTVIKDRRLLRRLGFLQDTSSGSAPQTDAAQTDAAAPAPAAAPVPTNGASAS